MKEGVHGNYKVKWDQQDKVLAHSRHHEVCIGFSHSHFVLPIPLHLAPSFATPVCCISYYLHFEFVTTEDSGGQQEVPKEEGGSEWQGPSKLDIETMVWDLPVKLYTTFPNHAAQVYLGSLYMVEITVVLTAKLFLEKKKLLNGLLIVFF